MINENQAREEKIINLLSFASRMGKLVYGKERLERYLNTAETKILFLASDCSSNTKKYWVNKCDSTECQLFIFNSKTKKELAARLGKKELSAVSTSNMDITNGIKKIMENR